jgi:hypothetical protein
LFGELVRLVALRLAAAGGKRQPKGTGRREREHRTPAESCIHEFLLDRGLSGAGEGRSWLIVSEVFQDANTEVTYQR